MDSLISILIPNYNKALYIREALDSILYQTYSHWECIVVDDHSTDDSWEILESYSLVDSRFEIHKRPETLPSGGNSCRNHALSLCTGNYILFFDSDDVLFPSALENRLKIISESILDFVVFNGLEWDFSSVECFSISNNFDDKKIYSYFLSFKPLWVTPSVLFTKNFITTKTIQWDEGMPFYQDIFFNLKILSVGGTYVFKNQYDWIWRKHLQGGNVGSNVDKPLKKGSLLVFLLKYYEYLKQFRKDHNNIICNYCTYRFFSFVRTRSNEPEFSNYFTYLLVLKKLSLVSYIDCLFLEMMGRIGHFAYAKNISILKSFFYRVWVGKILKKYSSSYDDFPIESSKIRFPISNFKNYFELKA